MGQPLFYRILLVVAVCGIAGLVPVSTSARPNLQLTVANKDPDQRAFDVTVQVGNQQPIGVGRISKDKPTIQYDLPVPNSASITLKASFPGSAVVDSQNFQSQVDTASYEFDVTVTGGKPADAAGFDALFSAMGQPNGFAPYPLTKALNELLGGIALVDPSSGSQGTPTVIHAYTIRNALKTKAIDPQTVHFNGTTTNVTSDIESSIAAKAAVTLAFLGSWQVSFSNSALNQFSEKVTNLGLTDASPIWSIGEAVDAVKNTTEFKVFCGRANTAGKNAYVVFVDSLYGVQNGEFSTKSSTVVAAGTGLTANTIVSGDAAYNYSDTFTSDKSFSDEVLNADGSPYSIKDVCAPPAVETVAVRGHAASLAQHNDTNALTYDFSIPASSSSQTIYIKRIVSAKERLDRVRPSAKIYLNKSIGAAFARPGL